MRVSSPTMAEAVREGAADGGADVLDLGLVGTEMVYFAVGELGLDGGIAVTASHNPEGDNGFKIVGPGGRKLDDPTCSEVERWLQTPPGPVNLGATDDATTAVRNAWRGRLWRAEWARAR